MPGSLIRAQLRRTGGTVVTGPLMAGVIMALVGWGAVTAWPAAQVMTLVDLLVQVFVVCTGVCVAVAVTGDPLIELHEATPTPFRTVQTVRAGIVTVSGITGAVLMFASLYLLGVWPHGEDWLSLLSPVGAVILVAVVAVVTAAFAGTASAATIAVVTAWMFLAFFWDPYVLPLSLRRGLLMPAAAVLAVLAWRRLGDPERNIAKVVTG